MKLPNRVKNGRLSPSAFSEICLAVNGYDPYPNWPSLEVTEFQRYQMRCDLAQKRAQEALNAVGGAGQRREA